MRSLVLIDTEAAPGGCLDSMRHNCVILGLGDTFNLEADKEHAFFRLLTRWNCDPGGLGNVFAWSP